MGQPSTTPSSFMLLPPEVRDLIYAFAFQDHPVHVVDIRRHRSPGSLSRPKHRQLPALVHVSRQLRKEALPAVAKQCTLIFNDHFCFPELVALVPAEFARYVRRLSVKGDIWPPATLLLKFPSLRHVSYQHLGNCYYPPHRDNGFNKQAMKAKQADLVGLIRRSSPALGLLEDSLTGRSESAASTATTTTTIARPTTKSVQLTAEATVLSCHERVQVWVDVNADQVICRRLLGVHRLFDNIPEEKGLD
ncbi:hypothetical protein DV738_g5098, partial [Chaetothyriales sp. CBS 135597]